MYRSVLRFSLVVGLAATTIGLAACGGGAGQSQTAGPQSKQVDPAPDCRTVVDQKAVQDAVGAPVTPGPNLPGSSSDSSCEYDLSGSEFVAVTFTPGLVPGAGQATTFHGNQAWRKQDNQGCALHVTLNGTSKTTMNVNANIHTKSNACTIADKVATAAFERIPDA